MLLLVRYRAAAFPGWECWVLAVGTFCCWLAPALSQSLAKWLLSSAPAQITPPLLLNLKTCMMVFLSQTR